MQVDLHQLELRHADLRIRDGARRRRLLASLAEIGQQTPVVVIAEGERFVLIDGYLRVEALGRLRQDVVWATAWAMSEPEALLAHRQLASSSVSALEDAWLLSRLRAHGLSLDELARRLCRSRSWVSRRLGLLDELATAAQACVRAGVVPPHAAMKHLVPLARANRRDCAALCAGLGPTRVSTREVGLLYEAWRRADAETRARLVADPLLFLRAQKSAARESDSDALLRKELGALAGIARRARRRVHQGHGRALGAGEAVAWSAAKDAFGALTAAIEETHAGSEHANGHPGAA